MKPQQGTLFYLIIVLEQFLQRVFYIITSDIGQKTKTPGINSENRNILPVHTGSRTQERSVSTHTQGDIEIKIIIGQQSCHRRFIIEYISKKIIETYIYVDLRFLGYQFFKQTFYLALFFYLIFTTKYANSHNFQSIRYSYNATIRSSAAATDRLPSLFP